MAIMCGGTRAVPVSRAIISLARVAVEDYNKTQNAFLEFGKVISAKRQVVCGFKYSITLEATDGAKKKVYETQIWEKSWLNSKEVLEFKPIGDAP